MGCEQYREALSARLDGEEEVAERAATERHLAGCAECRAWLESATTLNRYARTSLVPAAPLEIDQVLLDAAPGPRRARLGRALWIALGVVGVAQFLLGAAQIAGVGVVDTAHSHGLEAVLGGGPNHLWHESAAWNVALGAGFAWIALRRTRPQGLLPTLTAFVAVLTLLSTNDVIAGRVDAERILSHGLIVAGYLIILGLSRLVFDSGEPPSRSGPGDRTAWRVTFEEDERPAPPRLRLLRAPSATARVTTASTVRLGGGHAADRRHDRAA
ncbi:zf-HC2 domain-containing protein [Plantactinospora sonchi]|uniref:Zf-HC2 domain-containing protein n=1 Tax=Plantactinospora sonchi TaxID=1544735 RepID=A0ABU7S342_9ACTN